MNTLSAFSICVSVTFDPSPFTPDDFRSGLAASMTDTSKSRFFCLERKSSGRSHCRDLALLPPLSKSVIVEVVVAWSRPRPLSEAWGEDSLLAV